MLQAAAPLAHSDTIAFAVRREAGAERKTSPTPKNARAPASAAGRTRGCAPLRLLLTLAILAATAVGTAQARLTPDAPDALNSPRLVRTEDASVPGLFAEPTLDDILAIAKGISDTDGPPWSHFRDAQAALAAGDREAAARALKIVAEDPRTRAAVALWTWANLRQLGARPPEEAADRVQGVVFEVPAGDDVEYFAAYNDGRWRYVHAKGGGVFWENTDDPETSEITGRITATGQRLVPFAPRVPERALSLPPAIRVTLLTFAGPRQLTLTEAQFAPGEPTRPILGTLVEGLVRLMRHITDVVGSNPN